MLPSAQQKKKISKKPFVQVRLVIDLAAGLEALDIKLKEPTLFIEITHGNEDETLNKQWIPFSLSHITKVSKEKKTHYGKKNRASQESNSSVKGGKPQKQNFDLQTIDKFLATHMRKNKFATSVLSSHNTVTNNRITLNIPTSSGACQLVVTPEGHVSIHATPSDLDLSIETHGSIKTDTDIKCHSVSLIADNVKNTHSFVADTMDIRATKKVINTGTMSGKDSVILSAENAENSLTGKILGVNINVVGNTTLTNSGLLEAKKRLSIKTSAHVINNATGALKTDVLALDVQGMVNSGLVQSEKSIALKTQATLENQASGRISATGNLLLECETFQNSGHVNASESVTCRADTIVQKLKSSQILSDEQLLVAAKTRVENAGIMSADSTIVTVSDREAGLFTQWEGATLFGNKRVVADSRSVVNAGLMQTPSGTLTITAAAQFKNHKTGVAKVKESLEVSAGDFVNSGTLDATGPINCQADTLVQDQETSKMRSGTNLTLISKTDIKNAGILNGVRSVEMVSGDEITNKHKSIIETEGLLKISTPLLSNAGRMHSKKQFITAAHTCLNNTESGMLISNENLELSLSEHSQNHGEISAETVILSAKDFENGSSGEISGNDVHIVGDTTLGNSGLVDAFRKLNIQTNKTLTNRVLGTLKTGNTLEINAYKLRNFGLLRSEKILTLNIQDIFENIGTLIGGSIALTVASLSSLYSFYNKGNVITTGGDFTFVGQGISHDAVVFTTHQSIVITAYNIHLIAEIASSQNITLNHGGGVWVVNDVVKAARELGFNLSEGQTIKKARMVPGSLKYTLPLSATKPLLFLANQEAEAGHIYVYTPTRIIVGNNEHYITFKSKKNLRLHAQHVDAHKGRLLSVKGIKLKATEAIVLGREEARQVALQTHGNLSMEATYVRWNQLELKVGKDLHVKGIGNLVNTSSEVHVRGNVTWDIHTRHQILIGKSPQHPVRKILNKRKGFLGHIRHELLKHRLELLDSLNSEWALTNPSTIIIEGTLNVGHHVLDIFASNVYCKAFASTNPHGLIVKSFVPFTTVLETYVSGEHRRKHTFHRDTVTPIYSQRPKVILGIPLNAVFSVGSTLKASIPYFDVSGTLSAISIEIQAIRQGLLGQFDARITQAPMVENPFKAQISLLNYFESTGLYEISSGGSSVYKAVLPLDNITPQLPRMVLRLDGTLGMLSEKLRRLFPREKEEQLLIKALLREFGRGFLSEDLNTPQSIMRYLESNTIRYSNRLQKLIGTQPTGMFVQSLQKDTQVAEPCIIDTIETLVFEGGRSERILSPIALFPKNFDNRRLRNGAGCIFSLGDVSFSGTDGSAVHISGNIDAQGVVTFEDLDTVSRIRNMAIRNVSITHQSRQKNMMGKSTTQTTIEQRVVLDPQPGNEIVARGVRFTHVDNIHYSVAEDRLGKDGFIVEGASTFIDEARAKTDIGPITTKKQQGVLGLSSTSMTTQQVKESAIGSVIYSEGPINIQSTYAKFDATQFKNAQGNDNHVTFRIQDLHFHELLRQIEAQDRAAAEALKDQERTARRKKRQGTVWLLVSLPVSYYMGGLASGWLQGLGVTGIKLAVAKGAVIGATGSAIRGQNIVRGTFEGGLFAGIGYGVANVPLLAGASPLMQDVAGGVVSGATSAALHRGNILESAIIGGISARVASKLVPGTANEFTVLESVLKATLESGTAALLHGGTLDDLVINLGSAAMGASVGKAAFNLGSSHTEKSGTAAQPTVTTTSSSSSAASATTTSTTTTKTPARARAPARRYGLGGDADFDRELNELSRKTKSLSLDADRARTQRETSGGLRRTPTLDNAHSDATASSSASAFLESKSNGLFWNAPDQRRVEGTFGTGNNTAQDLSPLGKVGRASIKTIGFVGRKIGDVLHAHPEVLELVDAWSKTTSLIDEYATSKGVGTLGKEKEFSDARVKLSQSFAEGMEQVGSIYARYCDKYNISKEDQAGAASFSLLVLAVKGKGVVKLGDKVQRPLIKDIPSIKSRMKASGLPNEGKFRFIPDQRYSPETPLLKGENGGYLDKFKNEWVKGPSRTAGETFEWDVQLSHLGKQQLGWASRDGKHINVSLKGHITHK